MILLAIDFAGIAWVRASHTVGIASSMRSDSNGLVAHRRLIFKSYILDFSAQISSPQQCCAALCSALLCTTSALLCLLHLQIFFVYMSAQLLQFQTIRSLHSIGSELTVITEISRSVKPMYYKRS